MFKHATMNRAYRLVWSELRGSWVAVAEFARAAGKRASTAILASATAALTGGAVAADIPATTLPTGAQVVAGQVGISTGGARMDVNQASNSAIVNWNSFNIGSQARVSFNQPDASSVILNRVLGGNGSTILGQMSANGKVFLVDPGGILFAPGAQVDVGGLVASTLGISDANFLSGKYLFENGGAAGAVTNQGVISAANGGFVALIAPQVSNNGTITADRGSVGLVAGGKVSLDFDHDGLLSFQVDVAEAGARAGNSGLVVADGGRVVMNAQAKDALLSTVLNNEGVIRARSLESRNGEIWLGGGNSGVVRVSGTLDASGTANGQTGGMVKVLGDKVGLFEQAKVDVSGVGAGGTALIGGNWQGKGPEQNATATYVGKDVTINADAVGSGDGGKVVVWADGITRFFGSILSRGGKTGGDGGSVEVSGKETLVFRGTVQVAAPSGVGGHLLLDPRDLIIDGGLTNAVPLDDSTDTAIVGNTVAFATNGAADTTITEGALEAIGPGSTIDLQAQNSITLGPTAFTGGLTFSNNTNVIFRTRNNTGDDGGSAKPAGINLAGVSITTSGTGSLTFNTSDQGTGAGTGGSGTYTPTVQLGQLTLGSGTLSASTAAGSGTTQGAITLNGDIKTAGGSVLFNGPVVLGASLTVDTTNANAVPAGANITFDEAVDGAFDLTLDAGTGTTNFNAAVGAGTAVGDGVGAALTINSTGATNFNDTLATGSGLTQANGAGDVTFKKNVTIAAGDTATTLNGNVVIDTTAGAVSFTAANNIAFGNATTDTLTLQGTAGNGVTLQTTTAGKTLTVNKTDGAIDLTLDTTGASNFNAAVGAGTAVGDGVGAALTINSTGATNFNDTLATGSGLTQANGAGDVTFKKNVTIAAGDTATTLNGNVVIDTTAGAVSFTAANNIAFGNATTDTLTLQGTAGNGVTLQTTTAGKTLTVNKTDGAIDLTLDTTGASNFNAAVGAGTAVGDGVGAALTINSTGATNFNDTLATGSGLTQANGAGDVTFKKNVTIAAGDTATTLNGNVVIDTTAGAVSFTAANNIAFGNATTDTLTLQGTAGNGVTLQTTTAGKTLTVNKTDGAIDLTLDTTGASNFNAAVGAGTAVGDGVGAALTINSTGATNFNDTLATGSGLTQANGAGDVTFKKNVTIAAGDTATTLNGNVVIDTTAGAVSFTAANNIAFGNATTDTLTLQGTAGNGVTLQTTTAGKTLTVNKTDGAIDLTLDTTGASNFNAAVGAGTAVGDGVGAALTINSTGATNFNDTLATGSGLTQANGAGDVTFKKNVTIAAGDTATTLNGNVVIDTTAGAVSFTAANNIAFGNATTDTLTLQGTAGNGVTLQTTTAGKTLTVNKTDGAIDLTLDTTGASNFNAAVGAGTAVGDGVGAALTINSTGATNFNDTLATGSGLTQANGAGDVTFKKNVTIAAGDTATTLNGNVVIDTTAGAVSFTAANNIAFGNATTDTLTLQGTAGNGVTLQTTTAGKTLTVNKTDGAIDLTLDTTGASNFNAAVGAGTAVGDGVGAALTINSTGATNFNDTLATGSGLTQANGAGDVTFKKNVTIAAGDTATTLNGNVVIDTTAGAVSFTAANNIAFGNATTDTLTLQGTAGNGVTLQTTTAGKTLTVNKTDGAIDLTLDTTGASNFNAAVGAGTAVGDGVGAALTINSTGATNFNDTLATGSGLTQANGAGDVTFKKNVTIAAGDTATTLNGNVVIDTTAGAVSFTAANNIAFGNATTDTLTLQGTAGNGVTLQTTTAGKTLTVNKTDGAIDLTLDTTGASNFNAAVGAGTAVGDGVGAALTINSTGATNFNDTLATGSGLTQANGAGDVTFKKNVTIAAGDTATTLNGNVVIDTTAGAVSFTAANNIAFGNATTDTLTLQGTAGNGVTLQTTTAGKTLTVNKTDGAIDLTLDTTGASNFNAAVGAGTAVGDGVGAALTINSTGATNFNDTLATGSGLTQANGAGDVTFKKNVTIAAGDTATTLNGNVVIDTTAGAVSFTAANNIAFGNATTDTLTLQGTAGNGVTLQTTTAGKTLTVNKTDGAIDLTLDTTGASNFNAAVGAGTAVGDGVGAALTINSTGATNFNDTLATGSGLTQANGAGDVTFKKNVTIAAGDTATTLNGNVVIDTTAGAVSFTAANNIAFGNATTDTLTLQGTAGNGVTLQTTTAGKTLTVNKTDGAIDLTLDTTGASNFNAAVGAGTAVGDGVGAALTINSTGATNFNDTLATGSGLTQANGAGDVTFKKNVTIAAGDTATTLNGNVVIDTTAGAVSFTAANNIAFGNATTDTLTLQGTAGNGVTLQTTTAGKTLTVNKTDGAIDLTLDTTGASNFNAAVGAGTAVGDGVGAALTINSTGATNFNDTLATGSGLTQANGAGDVTFKKNVTIAAGDTATTLNGNVVIDTTAGAVSFTAANNIAFGNATTDTLTLQGTAGNGVTLQTTTAGKTLTVNKTDGAIDLTLDTTGASNFNAAVGAGTAVGDGVGAALTINSTGATNFNDTLATGSGLTQANGAGDVTFKKNVTIAAGDTATTLNGNVVIDTTAGAVSFTAANNIAFGNATTDTLTLQGTAGNGVTLQTTTAGKTLTVNKTDGAIDLTLDTTGASNFNAAVGAGTAVGDGVGAALTINSTGATNFNDTLATGSGLTQANGAGDVTFKKNVTIAAGDTATTLNGNVVIDTTAGAVSFTAANNIAFGNATTDTLTLQGTAGNGVTLQTTTAGKTLTVNKTDGAIDLTLDTTGASNFNAAVGAGTAVGDGVGAALTINSTGATNFNDTLATGSGLTQANGAGDVTFKKNVTIAAGDTATTLNGNVVIDTTAGAVSFTAANNIAFGNATTDTLTLQGTAGNGVTLQTTTAGKTLTVNKTDGAIDLTLDTTGASNFNAAVGAGTAVGDGVGAALTINSTGATNFNDTLATGSGLTQANGAGDVTFKKNVTIAAGDTATTLNGNVVIDTTAGAVSFTAANNIAFGNATTDTLTLQGTAGNGVTLQTTTAGKTLTVNKTDGAIDLTLDTTGASNFNAAVGAGTAVGDGVGAALTINSTGATNFNDTLATGSGLTQANGAGDVTFKKNVTIAAGDTATTLNGNVVIDTTAGAVSFTAANNIAFGNATTDTLTLQGTAGNGVTLQTTTAGKTLTVNKTDGAIDLTLDTTGASNFNAAVGAGTAVGDGVGAALTINSTGATNFNDTLATGSGLTQANGAGDVTFKKNVTIAAGDTATTLNGNVVIDTTAGAVSFTAANNIAFGNATTDTLTLQGTAGNGVTLQTTTAGKTLTVNKTDGAIDLTLDTTGASNFNAAVGAGTAVGDGVGAALTINSTGATNFNDTLATGSGLTQANGAGDVTFKKNVTIAAGDTATTLNGNVVIDTTAGAVSFTAANNIAFGNATTDTLTLQGTAGNGVTLQTTTAGKTLTVNKTDGAIDLTLDTTGASNFNAAVGAGTAVGDGVGAALTINSTGATNFNDTLATGSGLTQANGAGAVTFKGNIAVGNGNSGTALDGDVVFNRVGGLTFTSGGSVSLGNAATDQITLSAPMTIDTSGANGNQTINGKVDGAASLTLSAGSGGVSITGATGSGAALTALTVTGGSISLGTIGAGGNGVTGNVVLTGSGAVSIGALRIGGYLDITAGGAVSQNGLWNIGGDLWARTTSGNITLDSYQNVLGGTVSLIAPLSLGAAGAGNSVALWADSIKVGKVRPSDSSTTNVGVTAARVTIKAPSGAAIQADGAQGLITADEPQGVTPALTIIADGEIGDKNTGTPKTVGLGIKVSGLVKVVSDALGAGTVMLFGDEAFQPKYEFAGDPTHRSVRYNGFEPQNAQLTGALDAAYLDIRNQTTEIRESGFAKENAGKVLRRGVVTSAGPGQPAVDDSTGMAGAEECEGGFANDSLSCQ